MRASALEAILTRDHPEEWARYQASRVIEGLDEALSEAEDDVDDAPLPGAFDGLLEGAEAENLSSLGLDEGDEADEDYEPLPGFGHWST